jgi:hypothetical protein
MRDAADRRQRLAVRRRHPTYAAVRKTERFKKVVRDLGLVEYWGARGWPAQCRPAGANDFSCD